MTKAEIEKSIEYLQNQIDIMDDRIDKILDLLEDLIENDHLRSTGNEL
jgi:prefoldin subunit 5